MAHTTSVSRTVAVSIPQAALWLSLTTLFGLLAYYFIGIDQGAVSIFGSDMHVHEFVHDARHLLGFPCH
ncbi:CbtB domain-containing protein [Mycobacteroides abscessus]|uniref:CbtB domain-containing protein n=1 Tax=Mycobacteroides abscessus TaxID=36809 RepID=UPI000C25CC6A|nr:CbtB-domain containing protein [Mycobacteroides abscessus]PVB23198.1 CbtB-domain containing protein [Mycobacteroides abscessus]